MVKYKLITFDLDGTLLVQKSSWGTLHEYFGTTSIARQTFELYHQGIIDYAEFMRRDISSWPKPLHISKISEILSNCSLRDEAEEVFESIHSKGIETAIISAGISLLADSIAKRLGIQHVYVNELCVDEKGFLTGDGIMRVDLMSKHLVLEDLAESLGLKLSECIAVDDSVYNANFLQKAGLGFYFGDKDIASKLGVKAIKSLREILDYILT
ncbi:MAG: HAD-IB family phosphatase [Candidatus Methylarchaceae archaeon HK01B]|nr:HAD-IB family phosphatase [Candidatus Methylarchaceae archaeon HK01M]MCP8311949.1 HAD-IB family phosphatase [Candidatus Methylarchaceae archaeon HK02M1]MCP8318666.1 HAD-IB family phosphatase [Candidatus Methylarchaceae archaeon HK01B]